MVALTDLDDYALAIEDDASLIDELSEVAFESIPTLFEALILRSTWRRAGHAVKYRADYPPARALKAALDGKQTAVDLSKATQTAILPLRTIPQDDLASWQEALCISALRMMECIRIPKTAAQAVCGAIGELIGNIYDHSGANASGIIGVACRDTALEFSVADAGRGILAGYMMNPKFGWISDEGQALELAVCKHVSRIDDPGRGNGFRVLLQALSSLDARIRVRSGRSALIGVGTAGNREFTLAQKGELQGFVVSVEIAGRP